MKLIKPPTQYIQSSRESSIFLVGSIEMGTAEKWQDKLINELSEFDNLVIYNPRRDDWDSSWVQSIHNKQFTEQVEWEQNYLESSNIVVFYFDPNTKPPITLMELGLIAGLDKLALVYCPDGFYRKGNVDILCENYGIQQVTSWDELVVELKDMVIEEIDLNSIIEDDFYNGN